jgi:hypothetical protein
MKPHWILISRSAEFRMRFVQGCFYGWQRKSWVQPSRGVAPDASFPVVNAVAAYVPKSVPKRGRKTIIRQPTPTKEPIKNGPEIVNFRPVL